MVARARKRRCGVDGAETRLLFLFCFGFCFCLHLLNQYSTDAAHDEHRSVFVVERRND